MAEKNNRKITELPYVETTSGLNNLLFKVYLCEGEDLCDFDLKQVLFRVEDDLSAFRRRNSNDLATAPYYCDDDSFLCNSWKYIAIAIPTKEVLAGILR